MTAFLYQYRQLDHRRGHINSRLNIRWWAWQWNTTKEINKHAIQVHYWRERIVTCNNEGSNYDQKHHARISMNDKHEQGKGIEIVRTRVLHERNLRNIEASYARVIQYQNLMYCHSWHQWRPHLTYKKLTFQSPWLQDSTINNNWGGACDTF